MSLRERLENPRLLMRLGMAFLVVALVAQRIVHPPRFAEDVADAVRGLCLGLSIGLNLWSVRLTARRRGCGNAG